MIVGYLFTALAYILILAFLVFNILAQEKYKKSKTVYISNPSPVCTFGTDLPTVNTESLKPCKTLTGNIVSDYFVYTTEGDTFVVSRKNQDFYAKICNKYCPDKLINGNCRNQNNKYINCINLLEPPQGCKNPSQALFVDQNGSPYFANDIFPSLSLGCILS